MHNILSLREHDLHLKCGNNFNFFQHIKIFFLYIAQGDDNIEWIPDGGGGGFAKKLIPIKWTLISLMGGAELTCMILALC